MSPFPRAYISNIDYQVEHHELREFLEQYTALRNVRIIHDRETGESRGFGFAEFYDEEQLGIVLNLHGSEFRGRKLNIRRAYDRPPAGKEQNEVNAK